MKKLNFLKILDATLIILICILAYKTIDNSNIKYKESRKNLIKDMRRSVIENLSKEILNDVFTKDVSIKSKFDALKKNVSDNDSITLINTVMKGVIGTFQNNTRILHTKSQEKHFIKYAKQFNLKEKSIKEYIENSAIYYASEVNYFHHGLRFADNKIKKYVFNRDILDIGSYDGDSFLILQKYTDKNIYCFEFSPKNIEKFHKKMKKHNISKGFTLIQKGVSDEKKTITIFDVGDTCVSINNNDGSDATEVELTTIDDEEKKHNMHVGFMKADVEGHGFHVIKGAINTIKRDRPVLSISIYHNIEEFFEIKPFLEKHLDNYIYEFHSENFCDVMSELTLFCYPKEIVQ